MSALYLPSAVSPNGSRCYGPSFADAEEAQRWCTTANATEGDGATVEPWTVRTVTASATVHPAGYEGECASCQEHAELFHAQHQEDLDRLPPPLPFCRPCADFALDQLHAEQAEIDRLDAEEPLVDDETADALLDAEGTGLAAWVDATDRRQDDAETGEDTERRYWSEA